jgi:hypothetical protein
MLILLDCRPLQKAGTSRETSWFIISCVKELMIRQGVEWIFLLDKSGEELALPANGKQLVRKTLPGRLGDKLWYSWLMPRMARREKVDLVMTGGGSPKTPGTNKAIKTPLCTWEMSEKGPIFSKDGTEVRIPLAPDGEVRSLSAAERENLKEETAGGREYFFADVTGQGASRVMNLLKAFSLFKKRQLSNMKLVLAGAGTIDKLDSYKYREDICLFPKGTEGLMEAAYAVIQTPYRSDPGIALLSAWRARTPVIMVANGTKWDPETVLRVPADNVGDLAEALKSLYKNEGIRNELIEKGASRVAGLSIRESAAAIGAFLGI